MDKVYIRKRSKIQNPFQNNNNRHDSILSWVTHPKILSLIVTVVSLLCAFFILFIGFEDVNEPPSFHTSSSVSSSLLRKQKTKYEKNDHSLKSTLPKITSSFQNHLDPNLKTMTFTLPYQNDKEETFQAYVQPNISTFYQNNNNNIHNEIIKPRFNGEAGKFINLSSQHLILYWGNSIKHKQHIADLRPFQAVGTATFPGHHFFLMLANESNNKNKNEILYDFHVVENQNIYPYDPYYDQESNTVNIELLQKELNRYEQEQYWLQRNNLEFGKLYYQFTGRQWLSLYPLRKPPMYRMWNADYFGQEHWVLTKETHYVKDPPESLLGMINSDELKHEDVLFRNRHLLDYRQQHEESMNMTIKVLSCAPRVFEIKNFLSHVEVDHIVHMATGMKLSLSTTSGGDENDRRSDSKTRTSKNSWVGRARSPIMDSIYRRAADLMQIDEALLRRRERGERSDIDHLGSNAEDFQLVHYDVSEQYTAHHDFAYPSAQKKSQPTRFATLLLYLNEGMDGGETSFPRWVNAETSNKLYVKPEVGKAVLFYSFLPDGNMDDLSQHAVSLIFIF